MQKISECLFYEIPQNIKNLEKINARCYIHVYNWLLQCKLPL